MSLTLLGCTGAAYFGILDLYGNAAAAWSVSRKLRAGYNGYAINVRRSSDNTTQDIGFASDGTLDTATLLSFCAATDGLVTKIYDQSGNGLDRVQATAANQAKIVSSGSLVTLNSKAAIDFAGGAAYYTAGTTSSFNYLHNGTISFISLVQNANNAGERFINTGGNSSGNIGVLLNSTTTNALQFAVAKGSAGNYCVNSLSGNNVFTAGSQFILGISIDASNGTANNRALLYVNQNTITFNNSASTANLPSSSNASVVLSAPPSSTPYTGKMQEMIFWNIDQTSNRTGIRDNQRTFYGTY